MEFEVMDKSIRRILSTFNITRNAANMDRLYLRRDQLGRGLICNNENSEVMLLNYYNYLNNSTRTKPLIEQERKEATHLGTIKEYLKQTY